jgi:RND family efflux transporter MFP subunit
VIVATSTEARDNVTLKVIGNGVARQSVTLYPAVAGEVAEVNFRTGQRVKAGQVLFRLVDRSQRLAAELAAARVDAAQVLARRYEGTRGTGAVPESVVDEARVALRAAQIELEQAREAVADRVVRAPFDGVLGLASVEVGDRVTTDTALVTLDDQRVLRLDFEVPEAYLSRVAARQPLTAANPAYPQRTFEGEITEIDSRVDPTTRTVRVRAALPNSDGLLRSGMSFQVQIQLPGQTHVSVPELALQWGRDGSFVWAVRNGNAVQVAARPVRRTAGRVLIDSELKVGEQVVVEGVQRLRADRPVRVIGNGS